MSWGRYTKYCRVINLRKMKYLVNLGEAEDLQKYFNDFSNQHPAERSGQGDR